MEYFFQHFINGISVGSIYALIAIGYTMVYGILQLINFAHSDVYMVGAFFGYYSAHLLGVTESPGFVSFLIVLLFAMAGCGILGFLIERLAYRPLRGAPKLNALITAIGVSLFLEYAGQLVFGSDHKAFPPLMNNPDLIKTENIQMSLYDVTLLGVSIVLVVVLNFVVYRTKIGKAMRAVSSNPTAASMMGIPVDKVISTTFVIGSMLAAAGGVLQGLKVGKIEPLMGVMIGLKGFVAAVLGGIGNLTGAVLGGLVMGLAEELVVAQGASTYKDALAFGILILILLVRPAGILGTFRVEKV